MRLQPLSSNKLFLINFNESSQRNLNIYLDYEQIFKISLELRCHK